MASGARRIISLSPATLELNLAENAPQATLTVVNNSDSSLAFKIKTTSPKRYVVKPNQEVLGPHASIDVIITLKAPEAEALLAMPADAAKASDRFMVSAVAVEDAFARDIAEKRSGAASKTALNAAFQALWDSKDKQDLFSEKTACRFVMSSEGGAAATPARAGSSAANLSAQPTPAMRNALSSPAAPTPAAAPRSAAPAPVAAVAATRPESAAPTPAAAPAAMSAAQARSSAPAAEAKAAAQESNGAAAGGHGAVVEAQKYKELLNLVVALTEERDRFHAAYRDATKELQLRSMRESAEPAQSVSATAPAKTGYQLWHLLLVAVLSFLVSRLVVLREVQLHASAAGKAAHSTPA